MTEQAMLDNQIVPAPQSEGGELPVANPIEAYSNLHEPGNEQIAATARELLDGVEVAPGAWERPGAKALAVAATEWTLQDPRRQHTARDFMAEMLKAENHDDHTAIISRARELHDEQLATAARAWFASDNSVLATGRSTLGVTAETERPFEIIAINLDSGTYGGEDHAARADAWSKALTGNENNRMPSVLVYKPQADTPPIMVLDRGTIEALINPQHPNHRGAVRAVTHEYGHTQRDIITTEAIGLGSEERMAIIVAGGQESYPETWLYEVVLDSITGQEYGQKFLDAIAGRATMDEVYEVITKAAGPQAALAFAGIPPQSDTEHYALPAYAAALMQAGETRPSAVYRNLTEAVDPAVLTAGLGTLSNVQAKHFMLIASSLQVNMPPDVIQTLISRLTPADNPQHFQSLFSKTE